MNSVEEFLFQIAEQFKGYSAQVTHVSIESREAHSIVSVDVLVDHPLGVWKKTRELPEVAKELSESPPSLER